MSGIYGQYNLSKENRVNEENFLSAKQHLPGNEDENIWIVCDGRISNHRELRSRVIENGHKLRSNLEEETISHLYESYGEDFLNMLNGVFALALWDRKKQRLILACDRVGVKTIYYRFQNNILTFSSQIKPIISEPNFSKEIDYEAMTDYFSFYYVCSPLTIYKYLRRLPPGSFLCIQDEKILVKKYWDFTFQPDYSLKEKELVHEFPEVLKRCINRSLPEDKSWGVILSGGIDSTAIAAMLGTMNRKFKTYTVGYEEESYSEIENARLVAKRYNTQHHELMFSPNNLLDLLPKFINHACEPYGGWGSIPLMLLSERTKQENIDAIVYGGGGDELFAGYPTLIASRYARIYRKIPKFLRNCLIEPVVNKLPASYERLSFDQKLKLFISGAGLPPERAHMVYKEVFYKNERNKLFSSELRKEIGEFDPFNVFLQHLEKKNNEKLFNRLLYLDFKTFLPAQLFVVDVVSSCYGQEFISPFMDKEMLDLVQRMPFNLKLHKNTTKYIVRKSMQPYLPDEILKIGKRGLIIPEGLWLRDELKNFVKEVISEAEKKETGLFNFNYVKQIFNEHVEGKRNNARKLSCLVSFFLWKEKFT